MHGMQTDPRSLEKGGTLTVQQSRKPFSGRATPDRPKRAPSQTYVHYHNEVIYYQEDKADYLYVIISGYVRLTYILEDGNVVLLDVLRPGDAFGELGVHEGGHCETATAMGNVSLSQINASEFRENLDGREDLQAILTKLMARRYRWYMKSACNLSLNSLAMRLSQILILLFDSIGRNIEIENSKYLALPSVITQNDLGLMARGTRGNVNRLLKSWERKGWISLRDRQIILHRKSQLESVSADDKW